jgi:hypothetical protein
MARENKVHPLHRPQRSPMGSFRSEEREDNVSGGRTNVLFFHEDERSFIDRLSNSQKSPVVPSNTRRVDRVCESGRRLNTHFLVNQEFGYSRISRCLPFDLSSYSTRGEPASLACLLCELESNFVLSTTINHPTHAHLEKFDLNEQQSKPRSPR